MSNLLVMLEIDSAFTFLAGSLLVLCGPSGVGKSTLVKRLLSSLVEKPSQSSQGKEPWCSCCI